MFHCTEQIPYLQCSSKFPVEEVMTESHVCEEKSFLRSLDSDRRSVIECLNLEPGLG